MPPVIVEIQPRPSQPAADRDGLEYIGDLDEIVETTMCSCNAGDDNPY
jgi:hypothetical protein